MLLHQVLVVPGRVPCAIAHGTRFKGINGSSRATRITVKFEDAALREPGHGCYEFENTAVRELAQFESTTLRGPGPGAIAPVSRPRQFVV